MSDDRDPYVHAGRVANRLRAVENTFSSVGFTLDPEQAQALRELREVRHHLETRAWGPCVVCGAPPASEGPYGSALCADHHARVWSEEADRE